MAFRPKSSGELAAQIFDTTLFASEGTQHELDQKRLLEETKAALTKAFLEGNEAGQQRVTQAFKREGIRSGLQEMYLKELRSRRKKYDVTFRRPFNELIKAHASVETDLDARLERARVPVYDMDNLSVEQRAQLQKDFPAGNFLYHGAKGEALLKILETGKLSNVVGLREEERLAAEQTGSSPKFIPNNSGFEGISWNLNKIHALFGDRYHLAGLLGSPQVVLNQGEQLVIPSRPAPYEVVQISKEVDANIFYPSKNQLEAYKQLGLFTINSVLEELVHLGMVEEGKKNSFGELPIKVFFDRYTDEEIEQKMKDKYAIRSDQTIELHPDTRSQISLEKIPILAIWLHGLVATGRLQALPGFDGVETVREGYLRITKTTYLALARELKKETHPHEERMSTFSLEAVQVPVRDLYLVVPRQDLDYWRAALVCMKTMPRGILAYDGSRVRLENTATEFEGDHVAFTQALRTALQRQSEGYIDWEQDLLGKTVTPDLQSGHARQLVKESVIQERKSITKSPNGSLIMTTSSH